MKSGIGEYDSLHVSELNLFHKNPKIGDIEAIASSLMVNGMYRPIVVNKGTHTGRVNEVLAGNHTLKALRKLAEENPDEKKWQYAEVYMIDVDNDRATKIVLADNRTADLGSYDNKELKELLESVQDDLEGTAYNNSDLELLQELYSQASSLDELEAQYGELTEEDLNVVIRLKVPQIIADQWNDWRAPFDSPEEAFEALMDRQNYD